MDRQYPFSEQKQLEAKFKIKETDTTGSQILFFPVVLARRQVAQALKSLELTKGF